MKSISFQFMGEAIVLAIGLFLGGRAIKQGIVQFKEMDRTVTAKGLSEKEVQADKIYLGKDNRRYIRAMHMDCFNHPLGRPPKEENDVHLEDKKRAIGERNEVEATFGTSKRVYRANNIRAKLDETADTWIGACFFAKNVMTYLRGLLRLILGILGQKPIMGQLYNNEAKLVPVYAYYRLWHLIHTLLHIYGIPYTFVLSHEDVRCYAAASYRRDFRNPCQCF